MTLTLHDDVIQGTDAWHDQRRGLVTASAVGKLVSSRTLGAIEYGCPECSAPEQEPCFSKVKPGAVIKTLHPERVEFAKRTGATVLETATGDLAQGLTLLLAAERITGWTDPTYVSDDMLRGIDDEPRARGKYADHYAPVDEVGFITEDRWGFTIGYSPDGLVGDDGLIEVKSRRAKVQLATILKDAVPAENMAQLQAGLLVSGRQWIDYVSYCGGMPLYVKRVFPQQEWFDAITRAVGSLEFTVAEMIAAYSRSTEGLHPTERVIEMEMVI